MKKLLIAGLAAFAIATPSVFAVPTVSFQDSYGTTGGGEFIATVTDGTDTKTYIAFCLELNESLSFATSYAFVIGPAAVKGGLGGGSPDPISKGAAYLYDAFINGGLTGYGSGGVADRIADADDLQMAIWWLEDELSLADPGANQWISQALGYFGLPPVTDLKQDATAAMGFDAQVLNPYSFGIDPKTGERGIIYHQSVLIPLPDGGFTLALLGMGLSGLALLRRKH